MPNLYLIVGKCDDGSEKNIVAFVDRDRAKEFAKKLRDLTKFNTLFERKLMDEFVVAYYANNPHPSAPTKPEPNEEFAAINKLFVAKQATAEDKKKFRWLQAAHIQNIEAWKKKFALFAVLSTEYQNTYKTAEKAWRVRHYKLPDALREVEKHWSPKYTDYSVRRLEVIE